MPIGDSGPTCFFEILVRHINSAIGAQILVKPKVVEHIPEVVVVTEAVDVDCSGHGVSCRRAKLRSKQGLVQVALGDVEDYPDVIPPLPPKRCSSMTKSARWMRPRILATNICRASPFPSLTGSVGVVAASSWMAEDRQNGPASRHGSLPGTPEAIFRRTELTLGHNPTRRHLRREPVPSRLPRGISSMKLSQHGEQLSALCSTTRIS
jgi:hypothetical protein